ncbi:hypothetical protein GCM10029964_056060 [Kibdelosporangium lantanae]
MDPLTAHRCRAWMIGSLQFQVLRWVERNYGYAVARTYAGHTGKRDAGTTTTYAGQTWRK